MSGLFIPQPLFDRMLMHCRSVLPDEACGMLAGPGSSPTHLYETINIEPTPVSYLMDPMEQFRIMKDMRDRGLRMIAIYHSHPQSPAYPSSRDIGLAFYDEVVYIIVSLTDREAPDIRAFRIVEGSVSELTVTSDDCLSPDRDAG
jgi:[CysO sulfur-carrier protein]-S-L-cysteine hydrolase